MSTIIGLVAVAILIIWVFAGNDDDDNNDYINFT